MNTRDILHNCVEKLPTIFDFPGLGNHNTPEQKEILRLVIRGITFFRPSGCIFTHFSKSVLTQYLLVSVCSHWRLIAVGMTEIS